MRRSVMDSQTAREATPAATRLGSVADVQHPRTPSEHYLAERLQDVDYRRAFFASRRRITQVDLAIVHIERGRIARGWTNAELARRSGLRTEAVRRLIASDHPEARRGMIDALDRALQDSPLRP